MRTPGPHARTRRAVAVSIFAAAGLVSLAGCDPRTLFFFLQPNDPVIEAPGPSLEGKRVVVVTSAVPSALGEYQALDRDVNRGVTALLREKVRKIDLVDPD